MNEGNSNKTSIQNESAWRKKRSRKYSPHLQGKAAIPLLQSEIGRGRSEDEMQAARHAIHRHFYEALTHANIEINVHARRIHPHTRIQGDKPLFLQVVIGWVLRLAL